MRYSLAFPLMCCAALSLSSCMGRPTPMARGYSSYDQLYKSAPGAKPHNIGYDYTNFDNKNVLQEMRYVAQDLVDKLDNKLSFSVDEIYLKVHKSTAFYNSFDHLIREELTQRGYALSNSPVNTVTVDFVSSDMLPECHPDAENNGGVYKILYLALALNVVEGEFRDSVGGFYEVPAFDYENTSHVDVMMPVCDVEPAEETPMAVSAEEDTAEEISEAMTEKEDAPVMSEAEALVKEAEAAAASKAEAQDMEGDVVVKDAVENPTDILTMMPKE